jgi:isopenicillin-N N-acyltransferase like protein
VFRKILRIVLIAFSALVGILLLFCVYVYIDVRISKPLPPAVNRSKYSDLQPVEASSGVYRIGNNWIRQNRYRLWEMYIEGNAFDRGVIAGKLSEKLVKEQEEIFVSQINKIIPSELYQKILLNGIAWFNRDLPEHVPTEYLEEIYGISLSASHRFDEYGPAYLRLLNYHAAHDIGHAMQNYKLIGCSSFAAWNEYSADSSLIVGRNFDFYFGDDFARNKIVEFVAPDSGYKFAFVTWGGMIGVVSGMNEKGLTVTINAGTLGMANHSATPVTLIARKILQYAGNIDEAIELASKENLFVSESFLVSSAHDKKAIIIEKRPGGEDIVWPDSAALICTNHYQGTKFATTIPNLRNKSENATGYRFLRIQQLLNQGKPLDPLVAASILRNKKGLDNTDIGYGNEKAVNQLLAHHSVIFEPEKRIMWVSTSPNVLGPYLAYDLNKIFSSATTSDISMDFDEKELEIPADTFIQSADYQNYLQFKLISAEIQQDIKSKIVLTDSLLELFQTLNPEYFETYSILGDYNFSTGNYNKAGEFYKSGLRRETNNASARKKIEDQYRICKKHIQP